MVLGIFKKGKRGNKPLWWIDYYHQGKRKRECVGTSRVLAEKALSIRKGEVLQGRYNMKPKGGLLFKDFANQWLEEKRLRLKHSTFIEYKNVLNGLLLPTFGSKRMGRITEGDIERFLSSLKGRGPHRINNILIPLKGILKVARRRRIIDVDFGETTKLLRVEKADIKPLSMEEIKLFLEEVDSNFTDYFTVAFFTGMRPSEQIALKHDNIDFTRGKIIIVEARVRGKEGSPKTVESNRLIDMLPPVKEAIERQAKSTFLKGPYVFLSKQGSVLNINNLRKRVWYPTLRKAKLKRRTMYQTRHTFATLMLSAGENPNWIARMMGHASTEMLFKKYSAYIPNITHQDGTAFMGKFFLDGHYMDTKGRRGVCKPDVTGD